MIGVKDFLINLLPYNMKEQEVLRQLNKKVCKFLTYFFYIYTIVSPFSSATRASIS